MANRRRTSWLDTGFSSFLGGGSAQYIFSLDGNLSINDLAGMTVTRTLVRISLSYSATTPVDSVQAISYGIGIADREAYAASILPDPGTAADAPARGWLLKDMVSYVQDDTILVPAMNMWYDIRAQRKLDEGRLYMIFQNDDVSGVSDSIQVRGLVRLLCLLP